MVLRGTLAEGRERLWALAGQSERTILLGTILLVSSAAALTGFVLAQYYSVDWFTSFSGAVEDCWHSSTTGLALPYDWGTQVGRHCFSDYASVVDMGMRPDPWESDAWEPGYAGQAAAMLPHLLFGAPAHWLGAPRLGLIGYLLALMIAVLTPAVWAARGARGLERVVVFVALGAAALPAWSVINRGNSAGFIVPIGLVFLVALRRQRWGLVTITVVLAAALVKPQLVILAVALFAARQWRWGGIAVGGVMAANLAAYLLWPRDFPKTIVQTTQNIFAFGSGRGHPDVDKFQMFQILAGVYNVSFGKGVLAIPDTIIRVKTSGVPEGFLLGPRLLIGYVVLVVVVVCVLALGRRIPPVMAGIALLATAVLFPAEVISYYLVFVLPIAALVARDPQGPPGSGVFERLGERRRVVGICVSLAAALSIALIALPGPPIRVPVKLKVFGASTELIVATTAIIAPLLWLIACAAIIVSYARRPAPLIAAGASTTSASGEPRPVAASQVARQ
jgi:hypothetical protein